MKKSLCIFVIIFAAALAGFLFAFHQIDSERENVVITEEVISGDPVWAQGMTLEFLSHWSSHALWDTKYTIGSGETVTEFSFEEDEILWPRSQSEYFQSDIITNFGTAVDASATTASAAVDIYNMWLSEILEDVASRAEAGETHVERVRLIDYYDYMPIDVSALSGERNVSFYSNGVDDFSEFFRVPVREDDVVEISITKNPGGLIVDVQCNQTTGRLGVDSTYYYGEEGCFFTFACIDYVTMEYADAGENRGLLYVPYLHEKYGYDTLDMERMKKVCELQENTLPCQLLWDEEGDALYMVSKRKDAYQLSVYDVTGTDVALRQELTVLEKESSDELPGWGNMTVENDGILLKWTDGSFSFVTERDGKCELWCSNQFIPGVNALTATENMGMVLTEVEQTDDIFQYEHALYFDGDRLILGCYESWNSLNMTVAVYSRQEQLYCGIYHHSTELEKDMTGVSEYTCVQGRNRLGSRSNRYDYEALRIWGE